MYFGTTTVLQNNIDHSVASLHILSFLLKETLGYNSKPPFVSPHSCQDVLLFVMQRKLLVEALSVNSTAQLSEEQVVDKK